MPPKKDIGLTIAKIAHKAADKKFGFDPVLIDLRALGSIYDYYYIVSGNSDKQTIAIKNSIEDDLRKKGYRASFIEGEREGRWVILDYFELLIHIFDVDTRSYYDLDGLFESVPKISLDEKPVIKALATDGAPAEKKSVRKKVASTEDMKSVTKKTTAPKKPVVKKAASPTKPVSAKPVRKSPVKKKITSPSS